MSVNAFMWLHKQYVTKDWNWRSREVATVKAVHCITHSLSPPRMLCVWSKIGRCLRFSLMGHQGSPLQNHNLGQIFLSLDASLGELRDLVMDREAWRAAIHGVAKSRTRLSDWTDWLNFLSFGWLSISVLVLFSPNANELPCIQSTLE